MKTLADRLNEAGGDLRDIVRVFFPNATEEEIKYILWNHTSYPLGSPDPKVSAKAYYAASLYRLKQTLEMGRVPCDGCGRPAKKNDSLCKGCRSGMK